MPKAIPITANERARSFGAVTSAMYACAMERFPAVSPSMTREANTIHSEFAAARMRKPRKVPTCETMRTGLRPSRSESDPSAGPATSWQSA